MTGLNNKKIALIATDGFEESELTFPKNELEKKGIHVDVISIDDKQKIRSWDQNDWGKEINVDKQITQVSPNDYDAIVLPGGQINPDILRTKPEVVDFIEHANNTDSVKALAAICHGPWLLVEADVIKDKKVTSFPSIKTDVKNSGGQWLDETVVSDGKLITSRNPDDLPQFVDEIVKKIA